MDNNNVLSFIKKVIANQPKDWLRLTTHRLDIYNESLAKTEFTTQFTELYNTTNPSTEALEKLPTAYDYIRLGHPLSCILEWTIAELNQLNYHQVISFDSNTMPIFALLRQNLLANKKTRILYYSSLSDNFDAKILRSIYGYNFTLEEVDPNTIISDFDGETILIENNTNFLSSKLKENVNYSLTIKDQQGSVLVINDDKNISAVSNIQHVRRRETVAMTPENALLVLKEILGEETIPSSIKNSDKKSVQESIQAITGTTAKPLVASSGLSTQYAIMMGVIDEANEKYTGKPIKFIVPPNCYGGTNDQARRVAAVNKNISIVDLPVDGDNDMSKSVELVLEKLAKEDSVPYIIAEIPTNPRVEVPDLEALKTALTKQRKTNTGEVAIPPVFILDQTFCPNVHFLGEGKILSSVAALSYSSGSKFPSGGLCTAGYVVANKIAEHLILKIEKHLSLCDNEATQLQYEILAKQLPSMNNRILQAYENTLEFVNFIKETLPEAKINFVSRELAEQSFTPSVFSMDLPTKGNSEEEKEQYKRAQNLKLINLMINKIPNESKFCVSYGQLKGCYWTIPATSTQGTTKEGDKDYIVRVAVSPSLDLEKHKAVFKEFVEETKIEN